jgi:transcriptional regulator with XRE-family HTH domain
MDASNLNWSEGGWQRLADAIVSARSARGLRQVELAMKAEVSRGTLQNLERGQAVRMATVFSVARALEWPHDHAEKLLAERVEGVPATTPLPSDLPLRVVDELEDGPLLDSTVLHLGDESGARMIVVVRGKPDASPEEIRKALEEWRRVERRIQKPAGDE